MSIEELFNEGYTTMSSLISDETCDKLKNYLDTKFNNNLPFNYSKGHYQLYLPNEIDNLPEEILLNNQIHNLLSEVFGKSYYMYSYSCNANLANEHQPYHMDCSHFHPINTIKKFGSPGPPIQIIVNIYLQDTDESNGSFEIVPKSHLFTEFEMDEDGKIPQKYITNTKKCILPKGSVIIRDKRTWHRGTKNNSNTIRYMAGIGYSLNWYKLGNLKFNKNTEDTLYYAPFSTWNLQFD